MVKFTQVVKLLCVIVACLCSIFVSAQIGYVDTSYYKGMGVDFKCTGGLVQPDSSVIIIGRFAYVHERFVNCITKLHKDGSNDYSFNPGKGADEHVNAVVRQPDGKLIIGGDFRKFNDTAVNHITRLNPDGSRDATFLSGAGFTLTGTVYAIYLLPDGKILVGGIFANYNGTNINNLVRLNSNGTIDNTFVTGTGFNQGVYSIDRQPDGKLLIGGAFTSYNGDNTAIRITRLEANGAKDPSFTVGFGANNIVTAAYATTGNKIVMGGFFTLYDSIVVNRIVRLNADGTRDNTFITGTGFNNNVNELAIQPDGKILATGGFTNYNGTTTNRIARLDVTGTKDAGFYIGTGLNLSANAVFLGENNNIYVGGTFTLVDSFSRHRLVRMLPTGKVDHSFMRESKVNQQVFAIGKQSTGKVILGGQFTRYNELMANRIVRLNADGTIDQSFASGIGASNIIRTIEVLPDDKILIGGDFTTYNGVARARIARLNADGSLDTSFVVGTGASGAVYKIMTIADGKIYISGAFTQYSGIARARIARLNSNGTLDATFATGTGLSPGLASEIAVQADGKVLVGGTFTSFAGTTVGRLVRILPTGAIDPAFNPGGAGAGNAVNAIVVQGDGSILIGGSFTTYNGIAKLRIARLNTNGGIDATFTGTANNVINDIAIVSGKILVAGNFTQTNSVTINRISALKMNGTNDTSFYVGTGAAAVVSTIFVDDRAKRVYLGGTFATIQSRLFVSHAAIKTTGIDLLDVPGPLCHGAIVYVKFKKATTYNSANSFVVQLSDSAGKFSSPTIIGAGFNNAAGLDSIDVLIPNNIPYSNNYYVRIVADNFVDTSNSFGPISIQLPLVPTIAASGPVAICPGQTVTLTSSVSGSYLWNTGETTRVIIADSTKNYTVTTSRYNCTATSAPVSVSTNNVPDSAIVATAGSFCNGGSIMLTAAANNRYNWSTGDTTQSITVTQSGNYTLLVTSTANCSADSTVSIDFNSIGNYLVTANGPTSFCQGSSVTLTSVPNATYAWSNGAVTQSIIVTQPGTYRVTVTDNNSCTAASTNQVVSVSPAPNATITASGPTTFCEGNSVTLSAANGLTYAWNNSTSGQSVTATESGFFNVTVTDPNTSCTAISNTTAVNVNSNPTVVYNQPESNVCNDGGNVQLTGASPAGGTFSGSGVSGTTFNPSAQSGNIVITYTYIDANNCTGQTFDAIAVDICSGIDEASAAMINIYPNPAYNTLNIATGGEMLGEIIVTDLTGKLLIQTTPNQGENIITLNITDLSAGTYLISVGDSKSRFIKAN